jgi:hypothetical protein
MASARVASSVKKILVKSVRYRQSRKMEVELVGLEVQEYLRARVTMTQV